MSVGVNKTIILGWVSNDPEVKTTNSGVTITKFTVSVKEVFKDKQGNKQERTEFFGITTFGKLAEIVSRFVKKSMQVYVEGHLKHEEWEKDGKKHRKLEIYGDTVQFLTKASDDNQQQNEETINEY